MGKEIEKTALKIINNNSCQILGSDAHNDKNRNFLLREAYDLTEKIMGEVAAQKLVLDNPRSVLEGVGIVLDTKLNNNNNL